MGNKVNVQITPEALHGVTPIKHVTIKTSEEEEDDDDDNKEEETNCCCCKCCLKIFSCLFAVL